MIAAFFNLLFLMALYIVYAYSVNTIYEICKKMVQFVPYDTLLKNLSRKAVSALYIFQTDSKVYSSPKVATKFVEVFE